MMKKTEFAVSNKQVMKAFIELRKGSRTSPQETRNKRLRTDERIIAAELKDEEDAKQ